MIRKPLFDNTRVKIIHGHDWDELENEINNFIIATENIVIKDMIPVTGTESTSRAILIRYIDYQEKWRNEEE